MIARRTIRIRLAEIAALCMAATFVVVTMLPAATGDTIADRELGEPDFLHSAAVNVNGVSLGTANGSGLSGVTALAIDSSGHLYAADTANNRVLGWHDEAALVTGQAADLVVGQIDLYSAGQRWERSSAVCHRQPESPSTARAICTCRTQATAACSSTTHLTQRAAECSRARSVQPTWCSASATIFSLAVATSARSP